MLDACVRVVTVHEIVAVSGAGSRVFASGQPAPVQVSLNVRVDCALDVCVHAVSKCACDALEVFCSECVCGDDFTVSFTYTAEYRKPPAGASAESQGLECARGARACCRHALELWIEFAGARVRACTVHEALCVRHLVEPTVARVLDAPALSLDGAVSSCTSARMHTGMCVSHCGTWLALMPAVTTAAISVFILNSDCDDANPVAATAVAEFRLPVQSARVHGAHMSVVHATCCFTAVATLLVCATTSTAHASYVAQYTRTGDVVCVYRTVPRGTRWIAAPRNQPAFFVTANCFGQASVLTLDGEVLSTYSASSICWGLTARWDARTHTLHVASINDGPQLTTTVIHLTTAATRMTALAPVHTTTAFAFPSGWKLATLNAADELVLTSATGYLPTDPFIEIAAGTSSLHYRTLQRLKRPVCALAMCNEAAYILDDAGQRIIVLKS